MKPPKLIKGDEIGIISPAGPVNEQDLERGVAILKKQGFSPKLGANVHALSRYNYMAGDDEERLCDIHYMFENKRIKAIISSRGGYGSLRLLEHIDYNIIKKNPKILVGYSDITAMIIAINKRTELVTLHGPVARDLFKLPLTDIEWFISMLEGKNNKNICVAGSHVIISGRTEGILLGGNLSIICHLIGTPFMPLTKEIILFVEDTNEPYYKIDRMFTHLKMSGFLDRVSGLILGSFEGCGKKDIIEQIVFEKVSDMGFPVISRFPIGHGNRNMTMPLGIKVELDTNNKRIMFLERPVI